MSSRPPSPGQNVPCGVPVNATASDPVAAQPQTDLEKRPWAAQYHGIPAFSEWMYSSNDFFINEIGKLERQIEDIDSLFRNQPAGHGRNDSFDEDPYPKRVDMIKELEGLLQRYYDLVNSFTEVRKRPTAQLSQVQNLRNWLESHPGAIHPDEQRFMEEEGDLFPILIQERSPLRRLIGHIPWLHALFKPRANTGQVESSDTQYTSGTGLNTFTTIIVLLTGLGLLFAPMWTLNEVTDDKKRLGIITAFVTGFTILAGLAAGQRPFEILAATAAYAAVLMVYLQNN